MFFLYPVNFLKNLHAAFFVTLNDCKTDTKYERKKITINQMIIMNDVTCEAVVTINCCCWKRST